MMTTIPGTPLNLDPNWSDDDARIEWIADASKTIETLAKAHGWDVTVERSGRSFSQYLELNRGDDEITIRVTDHESGIHGSSARHSLNATVKQAWLDAEWREVCEAITA